MSTQDPIFKTTWRTADRTDIECFQLHTSSQFDGEVLLIGTPAQVDEAVEGWLEAMRPELYGTRVHTLDANSTAKAVRVHWRKHGE